MPDSTCTAPLKTRASRFLLLIGKTLQCLANRSGRASASRVCDEGHPRAGRTARTTLCSSRSPTWPKCSPSSLPTASASNSSCSHSRYVRGLGRRSGSIAAFSPAQRINHQNVLPSFDPADKRSALHSALCSLHRYLYANRTDIGEAVASRCVELAGAPRGGGEEPGALKQFAAIVEKLVRARARMPAPPNPC